VMVRITPMGLRLLAHLDEPVQAVHRQQLGHLGRKRLGALTELLKVVTCGRLAAATTLDLHTSVPKSRMDY